MKKIFLTIALFLVILEFTQSQTHPITIHSGGRVASFQMTSAEYSSWISGDEFTNNSTKRHSIIQEIYQTFDDKFDFIFLVLNETDIPKDFPYYGELISTSNAVTGIGLPVYNDDQAYNSEGKLKSVMQLSARDYLMYGPALHELAHNWANFAIHTKDWSGTAEYDAIPHWGFTGGNTPGQLGGFQQNTLQANIGGNPNKYSVSRFGGFANGGNSVKYSELELYLMGMIPISGVSDFDVFNGLSGVTFTTTTVEFTASGRVTYNNAKILSDAGGPRVPSYTTSQKNFRLLTVILTPAPLTETEWTNADSQSEWFGRPSAGGLGYIYNFWEATMGLGTIETGNLQNALRTTQLNITQTSLTLGSSLGSNSHIDISSNISWTASADESWINITPASGSNNNTITVTATSQNPSTSPRTAIITITGSGITRTVSVTQNGLSLQTPPLIGTISQPNCTNASGSISLSGLPDIGNWTLTRTPSGSVISGSGTSYTVSNIPAGTYTFTVTNAAGTTSGPSQSVTINPGPVLPSVITMIVTDASQTTASTGGNITSDGGSSVTARGVCWATVSNPTISNSKTSDGSSAGTYTSIITNLTDGVTYHIRAYATNCKGTSYGADIQYLHKSTGISEPLNAELNIYPNPVTGVLNIEYENEVYLTINIINSQGNTLLREKVIYPVQHLDFSLYGSGLYILEFVKASGETKRVKVIKR